MIKNDNDGIPFYLNKRNAINLVIIIFLSGILFTSCKKNEYPKEYVYQRIDYPDADYRTANNDAYPYSLEYPAYSALSVPETKKTETFWLDFRFEKFRASLYTTFLGIKNKTEFVEKELIFNSMLIERLSEYSEINEIPVENNKHGYIATIYEIKGTPALPLAFYISDRNKFFYQGYLYFDYVPVADSVSDIIDGMKRDVTHMVESFRIK